jgi:hypothetical protein
MLHHQISNRDGCVTLETCVPRRCHQDISGLYTGDNRPLDLLMTTKPACYAVPMHEYWILRQLKPSFSVYIYVT